MKNALASIRKIVCFSILLLAIMVKASLCKAQSSVFIPVSGTVFSHPNDTVSIFGDVILQGKLGTAPGSVVDFYGNHWTNSAFASMTGKGNSEHAAGGLFRFVGNQKQKLSGGYNIHAKAGPSFPNLAVVNKSGIRLQDLNDLKIRGNLIFGKGALFLNGQNALVSDSIFGYSENTFVITGNNIGGGSLYRQPLTAGQRQIYPIGTQPNSYSPLALISETPFQDAVGARVFDHVFEKATSGEILDSDYVKKTWVLRSAAGKIPVKVLLQHEDRDEGARFALSRDSSYISLYRPEEGLWDMDSLNHSVINPGYLTTEKPRNYTYVNDRSFPNGIPVFPNDARSWFSVSTNGFSDITCPVVDFQLWAAQRYNGKWVQLFWRTFHEMNVERYEVQRKNDTASNFTTIGTLEGKGLNGYSDHLQYYYLTDKHPYDGLTKYRLKIISSSGCIVYTDLQQVSWGIDVKVWPNPTTGPTHIKVSGIEHDIVMQVVNTWGQILYKYTLSDNQTITLRHLPDATYFLVFRDPKKDYKLVTTVKLVVQHHSE